VNAKSSHGVSPPTSVTTLSTAPTATSAACTTISRVRLLANSPSTPDGRPRSRKGAADAVWMSATSVASLWFSMRNHWAPTVCIQPPMLLMSEAIQSARKSFTFSGANAPMAGGVAAAVIAVMASA
jgi:hypothetical protein